MRSTFKHVSIFYSSILKAITGKETLAFILLGNALLFPLAFGFYWVERDANSLVQSYGDGIWWAFATVTTVGYGDIVPVTAWGRVIAVFLMLGGATCFVGFTAVFIPMFMAEFTREVMENEEDQYDTIIQRLASIEKQLRQLSEKKD